MKFFRKKTLVVEATSPMGWEDAARRAVIIGKKVDSSFEIVKVKNLELTIDDEGVVIGYKAVIKLSNRR